MIGALLFPIQWYQTCIVLKRENSTLKNRVFQLVKKGFRVR